MNKNLRPFLLLSLLVILLFPLLRGTNEKSVSVAPAQNQGDLRTFFGPETFNRGWGKPVGINRVFSIADFEPPFVLHVRSDRVSSAWIFLNGNLILKPSNFSKKVTCFDLLVDPRTNMAESSATALPPGLEHEFPEAKRQHKSNVMPLSGLAHLAVLIAGEPGSSLTIWIEGKPLALRMVRPEGGRIEFPCGAVLEAPPNAVSQPTAIELKELPPIEANAVLNARSYVPQRKHLLGGFQAKPDGLTFNMPVKAIVPVAPLSTPGELPFLAQFMLDQNKYWLLPTDLLYDPQAGTAEFTIRHFSGTGIVGIEQNEETPEDPCRSGRQHIVSSDLDYTGGPNGECTIVLSSATVTYLDCPGQPTVDRGISDMTAACGGNVIVYFSGNFTIDTLRFVGTEGIGYEYLVCGVSGSIQGNYGSMMFTYGGYLDYAGQTYLVSGTQWEILSVSGPEVSWQSIGGTISFTGALGTAVAGVLTFIPGIPTYTIEVSWPVYRVELVTTNGPS
jgi:hypothetical protein